MMISILELLLFVLFVFVFLFYRFVICRSKKPASSQKTQQVIQSKPIRVRTIRRPQEVTPDTIGRPIRSQNRSLILTIVGIVVVFVIVMVARAFMSA